MARIRIPEGNAMKAVPIENIGACTLEQVRQDTRIPIQVVEDRQALAVSFAQTVLSYVRRANKRRRRVVTIMPVGPTGQWRLMADIAAREKVNLSRLSIISMDEYLAADGAHCVPRSDPLSFTGFIQDNFARKAIRRCGFQEKNWIVPDPQDMGAVDRAIRRWHGVDVCFAGIGLNGHIAFNEPPGLNDPWTDESFADSPTRVVRLAATTKATNSIFGTGGDLARVPDSAVTLGMKQILGARRIHVFLDWPWQRYPFRRSILGPVSRFFPASLVQTHGHVRFTVTRDVAVAHPLVPE